MLNICMLKRKLQLTSIGCLSVIASGFGTSVLAQEESTSPTLEEIVVTAQRREENLQSSPVSVVAVNADRIAELGIADPQGLANFIPNVSMGDGTGRGAGGTSIAIRGVSEARVSPVLDPAVGIYIDDVYYGRPQTAFLKLLDVERVEVLRGPQGTLFGKNSTGGAVRYITQKPRTDETRGYMKATLGEFDRFDIKGAINLPVSENLAVRFSAASLSQDGYVNQLAGGPALGNENTEFGSAQLRWLPTDRLDIHFGIDYTSRETDDGATKLIDYFGFNNSPDVGGAAASGNWNQRWGGTPLEYNPDIPASLYLVGGEGRQSLNDTESTGLVLNLAYEINDAVTLKAITGYRTVEEFTLRDPNDQANAHIFFDDIVEEGTDFFSQELQLSGTALSDRLNWVAGVYYSKDEPYRIELEDRYGRNSEANGVLIRNDTAEQETKSTGVYAQGTYDITDQLALTLGVRYTEDDKTFRLSQVSLWDAELEALGNQFGVGPFEVPGNVGCDPRITGSCVSQPQVSGGDTFSSTTPRIAVEYQWSDDLMTYASASKGFKAGGTNDSVADIDTPFEPEELWSYEIGLRSEFLDNRARVNLTFFSMDYEDKQITVAPSVDNASICVNRCTANAGDATIDGWELEALFAATDALTLHANIGGLDAEWDRIISGAGVTKTTEFARAPELSYNIGGRYTFEFGGDKTVVASLDYSYKDDQESSPQDSTTITIPEYDLLTARLKLIAQEGKWEASIFCSNCADEEYITGGAAWAGTTANTPFDYKPLSHSAFAGNGGSVANVNGVAPPGISLVNVGAPRMWGVDFKYSF